MVPTVDRTPPAPYYRQLSGELPCVLKIRNESASLGAKDERMGTNVLIGCQGDEFFLLGILKDSSGPVGMGSLLICILCSFFSKYSLPQFYSHQRNRKEVKGHGS
jgi:hypothetical protein